MRRLRSLGRRSRKEDEHDMPAPESQQDEWDEWDDNTPPDDDSEFVPFVPVTGRYDTYGEYADYAEEDADSDTYDVEPDTPRRRIHLPRPRVPRPHVPRMRIGRPGITIRLDMLLIVIFLVAAGIFGTLLKLDRIQHDVEVWWPAILVAAAGLWMLVALLRRRVASFLGGAAFAGLGLSLLMSTQDIAKFDETVMGVVLVTIGLGIVIRGFLLRQQAVP